MSKLDEFREGFAHRDEAFIKYWSSRLERRAFYVAAALAYFTLWILAICLLLTAAQELHIDTEHGTGYAAKAIVVPAWLFLGWWPYAVWTRSRQRRTEALLREGVLLDGKLQGGATFAALAPRVVSCMHGDERLVFAILAPPTKSGANDVTVLYLPGTREAFVFHSQLGMLAISARRTA